ncbi:unnamed protein product [Cochlearia groenlandica]
MACTTLKMALQKAAQLRMMEKAKSESASYATRISLQINRAYWSMLVDGRTFAEVEICDMKFDVDRDYRDIGVAQFTTKYFVIRNCLPNSISDTILSAWNPPPEWRKKNMLRVDAKQRASRDGTYSLEVLQVEIYPLEIYLTETMYKMMWEYFFPEEKHDSPKHQQVWKSSTTTGLKKGLAKHEYSGTTSQSTEAYRKSSNIRSSTDGSSIDKTREENVVANELGDSSKQKRKEKFKRVKSCRSSHVAKSSRKSKEEMIEFHNIKISQVELLVTYEGSRFVTNDLRLLMDTFVRVEFTGTWMGLFARVQKHIKWGVLKSLTGMQGKKFRYNSQEYPEFTDEDQLNLSDGELTWLKLKREGAGDGFVASVRGLFNTQRRKGKVYLLKTMRGEAENNLEGDWSDSDVEFTPFDRQLTITKAKRLIRRHTKKFRQSSQKSSTSQRQSLTLSPIGENIEAESADSSGWSSYEEFYE